MKHKISEPIDVNVNIEFDAQDVEDVVDKVGEVVFAIIVATTISHILRKVIR